MTPEEVVKPLTDLQKRLELELKEGLWTGSDLNRNSVTDTRETDVFGVMSESSAGR